MLWKKTILGRGQQGKDSTVGDIPRIDEREGGEGMGAGVSLPGRKNLHERAPDGETSPSLKQPPLPARGLLRTLGFKRSAVQLPHTGSWLEVTVFEARDLPAADDNGLSDPYVEIRMEGETSSRKTNVRMKTLKPKWQQELLLPVSADRAVGELTKKGAAEACYWFTSGNKLAVQVWDWNASTEDELLGSVALDLRALSMSRFEVELSKPRGRGKGMLMYYMQAA